ncbi:nucleic acid binding protein [Agapanthus carlavirus B]|uniref:Nucleic acid binding protein n=1 Tax=Agapanthus carlavirus B TaxID=2838076 RepID=A0A8E7PEF8_9VIRU|nr:nucleic acid binding protein [Agapanthus carlavirus B]QVY47455.1 nucleic acid binding protein [Agapanthus carlavirus B]
MDHHMYIVCVLIVNKVIPDLPDDIKREVLFRVYNLFVQSVQASRPGPFMGLSRSARKRRATKYNLCMLCGKMRGEHRCHRPTNSQYELLQLIKYGPIRRYAEKCRKDSNEEAIVHREILNIKYIKKLGMDYVRKASNSAT